MCKGALPNHFGKINVIVTLGGRGVEAVTLTHGFCVDIWCYCPFPVTLRGGEGGGLKLTSQ